MNDREWVAQDPGKRELPESWRPDDSFSVRIKKALHYPECWCTTAYPTLESALIELVECSKCTSDLCMHPSYEAKDEAAEAGIYKVVTEAGSLWSIVAKYGVEPTSNPIQLLSMYVIAVQEREEAFERIQRLRRQVDALVEEQPLMPPPMRPVAVDTSDIEQIGGRFYVRAGFASLEEAQRADHWLVGMKDWSS